MNGVGLGLAECTFCEKIVDPSNWKKILLISARVAALALILVELLDLSFLALVAFASGAHMHPIGVIVLTVEILTIIAVLCLGSKCKIFSFDASFLEIFVALCCNALIVAAFCVLLSF